MKIKKADLEKVAALREQYPDMDLPEIAFVGRSNVGKSSMINAMLNRKSLAKTSSTPGKTRTINFYRVNDDLRLVDLPGYGYAKVSKKEKGSWSSIINTYLNHRENLIEVILLVDARHEPTDQDKQMFEAIRQIGYSGIVIATKADKISKSKYNKSANIIAKKLGMEVKDNIIFFSSTNKEYVDELWEIFEDMIEFHREEEWSSSLFFSSLGSKLVFQLKFYFKFLLYFLR